MQFIDEIERIDSSSPLRRNVKAALSRREAEVIVMRRLFNYERSCGLWHENYRQVSLRCWAVTKQLLKMGCIMPAIVSSPPRTVHGDSTRASLSASVKADRQLSHLNNSSLSGAWFTRRILCERGDTEVINNRLRRAGLIVRLARMIPNSLLSLSDKIIRRSR